MSEVSCTALELLFRVLEVRRIPATGLLDGTGIGPHQVGDRRSWMTWDAFVDVLDRFEDRLGGPDEVYAAGLEMLEVQNYRSYLRAFGRFVRPALLYKYGARMMGNMMFTIVESEVDVLDARHVRFELRIPEPWRESAPFFRICQGAFAVHPIVLGYQPAVVDLQVTPRRGVYQIEVPEGRRQGLLERWTRRWSAWRAMDVLLVEYSENQARVRDQQILLRKAQRRIEEQVGQLEVTRDALVESEARWRALATSVPDPVIVADRQGRIQFVSKSPGLDAEQVLGRGLVELTLPDERDRVSGLLAQVLETGRPVHWEAPWGPPDGDPRTFDCHMGPMVEDGVITGATLVARDVTEARQEADARLELERQVLHAQKLESLGILAGGIAHDFNNLLMSILGNTDLLLMEAPLQETDRERLERVARAAERAAELTRQMLAYSGRAPFDVRPVDVAATVADMADLLVAAVPKRVRLVREIAPDLPAVEGEPARVQQVVMNLLANAGEAIGDDEGTVTVRARVAALAPGERPPELVGGTLEPGSYVVLEVADDGCGISPDVRERIFDPFFSTKGAGRGLGLASVLGILRGHGGALELRSQPGTGSLFRAWFPVSVVAPAPEPKPQAPPLESGRVLVVDDEELVRETAADLLRAHGFEVDVAADGPQALLRVKAGGPLDAVLLDLTMPGPSGDQVFREIRALRPDLPVVLCSAYDVGKDIDELYALGLTGFLRKPYRTEALLALLREHISPE